jgi:hypothetical protein
MARAHWRTGSWRNATRTSQGCTLGRRKGRRSGQGEEEGGEKERRGRFSCWEESKAWRGEQQIGISIFSSRVVISFFITVVLTIPYIFGPNSVENLL